MAVLSYQALADAVLLLHFAVVLFVVGGLAFVVAGNEWHWPLANNLWFRLAHVTAIGVVVLQAWLGQAPDRSSQARLAVMRLVTAVYYAALIFTVTTPPRGQPYASLDAPDPAAFRAAAEAGRLSTMGPEAMPTLGLVYLNGFLAGLATPEFRDALAVVRAG